MSRAASARVFGVSDSPAVSPLRGPPFTATILETFAPSLATRNAIHAPMEFPTSTAPVGASFASSVA